VCIKNLDFVNKELTNASKCIKKIMENMPRSDLKINILDIQNERTKRRQKSNGLQTYKTERCNKNI